MEEAEEKKKDEKEEESRKKKEEVEKKKEISAQLLVQEEETSPDLDSNKKKEMIDKRLPPPSHTHTHPAPQRRRGVTKWVCSVCTLICTCAFCDLESAYYKHVFFCWCCFALRDAVSTPPGQPGGESAISFSPSQEKNWLQWRNKSCTPLVQDGLFLRHLSSRVRGGAF